VGIGGGAFVEVSIEELIYGGVISARPVMNVVASYKELLTIKFRSEFIEKCVYGVR